MIDGFRKATFVCLLIWFVKTGELGAQYANIPWSMPISVSIESTHLGLVFGTKQNATSGYDAGIDEIAPPPGFNPYAFFQIQEFPNILKSDFRAPNSQTTWTLEIVNTNGGTYNLRWDSSQFPVNGFQRPGSLVLNDTCNLLEKSTCQFVGDQKLSILYVPPTITGLPSVLESSVSAKLLGNYPNPFNNSTTIKYCVPVEGSYTISIYGVSGKLVRSLVSAAKSQGDHQITLDGTNNEGGLVASGVYMILFHTKSFVFTKKVLLIK